MGHRPWRYGLSDHHQVTKASYPNSLISDCNHKIREVGGKGKHPSPLLMSTGNKEMPEALAEHKMNKMNEV